MNWLSQEPSTEPPEPEALPHEDPEPPEEEPEELPEDPAPDEPPTEFEPDEDAQEASFHFGYLSAEKVSASPVSQVNLAQDYARLLV